MINQALYGLLNALAELTDSPDNRDARDRAYELLGDLGEALYEGDEQPSVVFCASEENENDILEYTVRFVTKLEDCQDQDSCEDEDGCACDGRCEI